MLMLLVWIMNKCLLYIMQCCLEISKQLIYCSKKELVLMQQIRKKKIYIHLYFNTF